MTRKQRVTAAFSAAAGSYESAAQAQVIAADRLTALVLSEGLPAEPRVLEVGCGTGILTRRLLPAVGGHWLVTDISSAMVEAAQAAIADPRADFRVMDGESPDVAGPFDLIVSNLAAQWFADLPQALARLAGLLAPGGRIAISTLGAGSLAEWRKAHASLGLACGTPPYPTFDELKAMLPAGGQASVVAEPFVVRYSDARAFVGALKGIGAGTPQAGHQPLTPGAMRRVLAVLGSPTSMTYDLMLAMFTAEKK